MELPLVVGHFLHNFLKPPFRNLLSSVRNSTVCLGQDLKQFPFWNYFLVVSCEEFAVVVNPFPSSYHLLFHFDNCFGLDQSLFPERRGCFSVFSFKKSLAFL